MAEEPLKKPEKSEKKRLEVETPEEAGSLQKDTSGKVSDVVGKSSEDLPEYSFENLDGDEFFEKKGNFFRNLRKLLAVAGFGKKTIFSCIIGLFLIAGIVMFFSFGGFSNISAGIQKLISKIPFGDDGESEQHEDGKKTPAKIVFTPMYVGLQTAFVVGEHGGFLKNVSSAFLPSSLQNAYLYGTLHLPSEILSGTEDIFSLAYYYGYRGPPSDRYAQYIFVLGAIQNSLNTDVFALLDQTGNRTKALENHIHELDQLLLIAQQMSDFTIREMATFKNQFNSLKDLKRQAEKDFFVSVDTFAGLGPRDFLEAFIQYGQQMVDMKARNLALNKVQTLYKTALKKLDARIRDLKTNREALVKGLRVVDIQNSDLRIILQEGENLE